MKTHSPGIDISEIKKNFSLHTNYRAGACICVLPFFQKSQFREGLSFQKLLHYWIFLQFIPC